MTFAPALEILTYSVAVDEYEHEEEPHWKALWDFPKVWGYLILGQ